jgi:hypothetical protein
LVPQIDADCGAHSWTRKDSGEPYLLIMIGIFD